MTLDLQERFPTLFPTQGRQQAHDAVLQALNSLLEGERDGSIRNAVYVEAKDLINRQVALAWDNIQRIYLSVYRRQNETAEMHNLVRFSQQAEAASDLYMASVSSLHDVLRLRKKIEIAEKSILSGSPYKAFLQAADHFDREIVDLAVTVRNLKGKTFKGRVARPKPEPVNPDQVRGICPCCFSEQAVRSGTMVHHGYHRTNHGFQTSSCPGIRYKPFERSAGGTEAMIDREKARIVRCREMLEERDGWTKITKIEDVRVSPEHPNGCKLVTFLRGEKGWGRAWKTRVRELNRDIAAAQSTLEFYEKKKSDWKLAPLHKADGSVLSVDFDG